MFPGFVPAPATPPVAGPRVRVMRVGHCVEGVHDVADGVVRAVGEVFEEEAEPVRPVGVLVAGDVPPVPVEPPRWEVRLDQFSQVVHHVQPFVFSVVVVAVGYGGRLAS